MPDSDGSFGGRRWGLRWRWQDNKSTRNFGWWCIGLDVVKKTLWLMFECFWELALIESYFITDDSCPDFEEIQVALHIGCEMVTGASNNDSTTGELVKQMKIDL